MGPQRLRGDVEYLGRGEQALPGNLTGDLQAIDGMPEGQKIHDLTGLASAFTPDNAPDEIFETATGLLKRLASRLEHRPAEKVWLA